MNPSSTSEGCRQKYLSKSVCIYEFRSRRLLCMSYSCTFRLCRLSTEKLFLNKPDSASHLLYCGGLRACLLTEHGLHGQYSLLMVTPSTPERPGGYEQGLPTCCTQSSGIQLSSRIDDLRLCFHWVMPTCHADRASEALPTNKPFWLGSSSCFMTYVTIKPSLKIKFCLQGTRNMNVGPTYITTKELPLVRCDMRGESLRNFPLYISYT